MYTQVLVVVTSPQSFKLFIWEFWILLHLIHYITKKAHCVHVDLNKKYCIRKYYYNLQR